MQRRISGFAKPYRETVSKPGLIRPPERDRRA
nr:MAG TPA: hypothetical protein [Caudoviricetes sp.]